MRILFLTATRIGDAVLTTGLLDHLHRQYPRARFTIACGVPAAGLFTHFPGLERLIMIEKRRYDRHWLQLWAKLVGTRWDLVVDLRGSLLSFCLYANRRAILTKRRAEGHKIAQIASVLGVAPPPMPTIWTSNEDRARAALLVPPGVAAIALGPTANWVGKIWPPDRFVALYRALAQGSLAGARPVVLAGPGGQEAALAAPVLAALPNAIDLCGTLSLTQAAAVIARCALFIGNDSGLMHLAAATGTPTLGLYGPSRAAEYGPVGAHATAVTAGTPRLPAPIGDLTLDAAFAAAVGLLATCSLAA